METALDISDRPKRRLKTHRERVRTSFYPNITVETSPRQTYTVVHPEREPELIPGFQTSQVLARKVLKHDVDDK